MLKNGYTRYRSAVTDGNEGRYIGFNKRGKFMKETREEKLTSPLRRCLNFLKLDTNFDINDHNRKVAGLKDNVDITSKLQNIRLHNLTSQSNDLPYVYRTSHHVKIRHKNHHHQNINEITWSYFILVFIILFFCCFLFLYIRTILYIDPIITKYAYIRFPPNVSPL